MRSKGCLDVVWTMDQFIVLDLFHQKHPQQSFSHLMFQSIDNIELADPRYNEKDRVDGIIGVDVLASQLLDGLRRNSLGLLAQNTTFGWIECGGPSTEIEVDPLRSVNLVTTGELYAQIRKLWEMEETSERRGMSVEDQECERLYQSTVVHRDGKYGVTLLLKPGAKLGKSRSMARRRLYCFGNRFKKNPELKAAYVQFMTEYEQLGHMRKAEPLKPDVLHYYIPHHAVAIDRKFRVVFDASAKTTNGRSLNEMQYAGPRLQKDLIDIMMNFRTGRFAITADICKMFRQIAVQPHFWDLQRILWRRSQEEPICEYWLTVVTYGMVSSPYNAMKTLIKCALDNAEEFPRAAKVVQSDLYVDDLLTSVETKAEAVTLKAEVIALLEKGQFELAKWRSNCEPIMSVVVDEKVVSEQDSTSVLGIVWNYRDDEFRFKVQGRSQPEVITKRVMTSEAARVYDPQGYVTPITIRAKLFIQEMWRNGSDWDVPLPAELQREWKKFYEEIKTIAQIRIPRWLGTTSSTKMQIHLYCDASKKAYGAAAYVRVCENGSWSAKLLCSKSRVAPIKIVTIPRLELSAIELGCSMLVRIKEIPMLANVGIFVWSDAEIALRWIRKPVNELKTFVANRVTRILEAITIEQSRHVRTEHNPADLLSRGVRAETLISNSLWWNGPEALRESTENWPLWKAIESDPEISQQVETEVKRPGIKFDHVLLTLMNEKEVESRLIDQFSSYRKACRITAYVFRFCHKSYEPVRRRRSKDENQWLRAYIHQSWESKATEAISVGEKSYIIIRPSIPECENALGYWIMKAQKESFPTE